VTSVVKGLFQRLATSRTVVIGLAAALFVVVSVLPFAYMVAVSLSSPAAARAAYSALLLDERQRGLLWNSAAIGAGTAGLASLVGVPLGLALARTRLPFKGVLRIALAMPVLLPPYIMGLAWIYLGGAAGLLAQVFGRDLLSNWTYSISGAVIVLGLVFYPLSMLTTEVALRRVDARLEEAAVLVAPPGHVLRRITLPLVAPSVLAAALVIFVLAISDFGVPGLLRVRVFTTEVFTAFAAFYDFGRATAIAFPLLLAATLIAAAATALTGERLLTPRRSSVGARAVFLDQDRSEGPALVLSAAVLVVAVLVPALVLISEATDLRALPRALQGSRAAVTNSLVLATIGATLIVALAMGLGYARARARHRLGGLMDVLFLVLFAVPSTIVGVGLIGLWNRAGLIGAVYGTDAMILLAYLGRFVPAAALVLAASIRQVPISHEEAAAVSGANWLRTIRHIVVPQVKLGMLAAWVVAFILSFGELGASILVAPAGDATLPIRIYTIIANAPPAQVAGLALLQAVVIFVPLAIMGLAVGVREGRSA